jgi:hypothetical protein
MMNHNFSTIIFLMDILCDNIIINEILVKILIKISIDKIIKSGGGEQDHKIVLFSVCLL